MAEFELTHADAVKPVQGTQKSAGIDLFSRETGIIQPLSVKAFATGVRIKKLPENTFIFLGSRSGLALRNSCFCIGGIVDSDFEGELVCLLYNGSPTDSLTIYSGSRICQALVLPRIGFIGDQQPIRKVRGKLGFGSTGFKSSNDMEFCTNDVERKNTNRKQRISVFKRSKQQKPHAQISNPTSEKLHSDTT